VNWTVIFSKAVTGVDTTDFTLTRGGSVTGGSVTGVSGGPSSYAVTATTGSGDGTLRLDLVDDDSIVDHVDNPLGGPGAGNGNFTGQAYAIDRAGPSVGPAVIVATTGTSPVGFAKQGSGYVIYADATDASGVSSVSANVTNVTSGATTVGLAVCSTACTVGGHTYGFKSAQQTASNPLTEGSKAFTISAADSLGNASTQGGFSVQVDNTGPSVSTVIAATVGTSPSGFVKQNSGYRVYANVTDLPSGAGNSSGVDASTITANVSTVTTGATAVALTSCGSCGPGNAFAFQSAAQTANTTLSEGNKLYSVTASDNLGTSGSSSGANVQVDNTAPTVSAAVAADVNGNVGGFIHQGGTYVVYANVADLPSGTGNFSGVNTVTADLSNVTTGAASVTLATCSTSCTIGGVTYGFKSTNQTAKNPLSGSQTYTITATDNLGNSNSGSPASFSVTVDNTPATLTAVTDTNGTIDGQIQTGDTMTLTFSKQISLSSLPNWAGGTNTNGTTTITESRSGNGNVQLTIAGITAQIDMGTNTYLMGNGTKSVTFNASWTLTGGTSLVVTVGTVASGGGDEALGTAQNMTFAPATGLLDRAGNQVGGTVTKTSFRPF
jgi:hypothetical protein